MATAPVSREVVRTQDVDAARARVGALFCPHGLRPHHDVDLHLDARRAGGSGAGVGIVDLDYGGTVDITPGPLETFYLVQIPRRGHARVQHEGQDVHSDPSVASVLSPRSSSVMTWSAGNPQLLVYLDRVLVEECARDLAGEEVDAPLVFDVGLPTESPPARSWLAAVECLRAELDGSRGGPADHLRTLGRSVAAQLVETHRSNWSAVLERTGRTGRGTVRRATAYIEEHLAEPLSVSALAASQGVCTRVLQDAFHRELDTTPSAFIRDLRMRTARARLLAADPGGTSVTEVALAVGLSHLGRFSVEYRARFGESPSRTLRAV